MKNIPSKLRNLVLLLCLSLICVLLAATFVAYSGRLGFIADQCCQLRLVYVAALFLVLVPLALLRAGKLCALAGLTVVLNVFPVVPFYFPGAECSANALKSKATPAAISSSVRNSAAAAQPDGTARDITLMTINIYGAHNQQYSSVVNLVKAKNPELLCINEITKSWMQRLNADLPEYKYRFDEGISGGAAIFSRVPIQRVTPADPIPVRRYGVRGRLEIAGRSVLICAVHPPAPTDRGRWLNRNKEFERLGADAVAAKEPVILIGDFNSTPFSPYFNRLLKNGKLCDSEQGKGIQPSWNALLKVVPPLVPIDHCLTSNQFTVLERYLGPNVGSDHLPVIVKLHLQETKS